MASKLAQQLKRESRDARRLPIDEDRLDDLYQILTKIQSKNLMLVEMLSLLVEKGFLRNQHKLHFYLDIYNETNDGKPEDLGDKFTRKKFVKALKTIATRLYPNDPEAFENRVYKAVMSNDHHLNEDIRLRLDDNVKKYLNEKTINLLRNFDRQLEIVYEIYLPENFNGKMAFNWQQIKYLEKKLPIMAVFRFLWDLQICPTYISPTHFFEITSKLIPPQSLLMGSSQKQSLFYSPQNITNYAKQAVFQKKLKLLDGDIGVNFFQFVMLLVRISIDVTKQKNDITKSVEGFLTLIKLKQTIAAKGEVKTKSNKFQQNVKTYFEQNKKTNKNNLQVQKGETKKKIQQILQVNQNIDEQSKNEFKQANVSAADILQIKKSLDDDHLPQIPERPIVQKQNQSTYSIDTKHVVIGEQLPKIPQKNKPAAPKKVDKKDQNANKYKPEQVKVPQLSTDHYNQILRTTKKPRINQEYPIILMDAVYPSDIPNLYLNPKAQIYLQTTYVYLGERSYQKAFINYIKARTLCENSKSQVTQFYFLILQAQIYEAAARDGMALLNYNRAKELAMSMINKQPTLKFIAYRGLACCLYHTQEYEYALKCFLKAKQIKGDQIQVESIENAVLANNIGCIYMILNRNNEAMKHLALSRSILDLKCGKFHQKSQVVQLNESKNKKAFIQMAPAYKTMWRTFVEKPGLKAQAKAKKK